MLHRPRRLVFTAAALCLLAACTPVSPTPTPSPAPSYRCTPEAGGDEFDCTQAQHDEMAAKDRLYAEAEAVYRKFFDEDVRIFRLGGITKTSAVLLETTTGDFLQDSMNLYRSFVAEERKTVGGEVKLAALRRLPGLSKAGSVVALRACTDASTTTTYIRGKAAGPGGIGEDTLYFGRVDGVLKIQGADGKAVKSC